MIHKDFGVVSARWGLTHIPEKIEMTFSDRWHLPSEFTHWRPMPPLDKHS